MLQPMIRVRTGSNPSLIPVYPLQGCCEILFPVLSDIGLDEVAAGVLVSDDPDEPTMGEKLENLDLLENEKRDNREPLEASLPDVAPTAASVNVLPDGMARTIKS